MKKNVDCANHGKRYAAFVCQHLNTTTKTGFWEPFDSDSTKIYDDDSLNGWCNECDKVLMEEGEWNDKAEGFAQIRLVCDQCFFAMKKFNRE